MTAENCLEGRRSIQLSYRGERQKQKRFNGFPLCFLALNEIKAVAPLSSLYAEVCPDMLRSERKGVLQSVLFLSSRNVSTKRCTFFNFFPERSKTLGNRVVSICFILLTLWLQCLQCVPAEPIRAELKKHRYDINKNTIRDNVQNPTR